MKPVAVITGASSGLGAAIARALAGQGYAVVLAARSAEPLRRLAEEISGQVGGEALALPTDVTQPAQIEALAQTALDRFGRIDVLVNNAGVAPIHSTASPTDEQIEAVLNTNLRAPILLSRAVLPAMLKQGSGHILNMASIAGHIGLPVSGLYVTSKFGLRGYTEALRRRLYRSGVHVSLISPGFIRTEMIDEFRLPGFLVPGPEAVARAIVRVLRRPRREVIIPFWYRWLIWLHDLAPGISDWVIHRAVPVVAASPSLRS